MEEPRYDVYFTGKLVEGADPDTARATFAKLFKASPEAAAKFFTGKPQLLKRDVSKAEALKHKAALHKAGMMAAFKAHTETSAAPAGTRGEAAEQPASRAPAADNDGGWSLAPAGSGVLKPEERREIAPRDIDTSNIKLASVFDTPESLSEPEPPPPDTSHLSVAQAGEDLLAERPEDPPPLPLDLDAITLAPPGTELEELHDDLPPLNPDISGLSLAQAGADILEGQSRPAPPPPPNTDHLKVEE